MNARKPIRMSTAVFLCSRRLPNTSGRLAVRRVPARLRCLLVFVAVVACALAGASDLGAAVPRRPPRLGQPAPRPPAGPTPAGAEPVEPAEVEPVEPPRLAQAVSDMTGATGMRIIRAIVAGERDPQVLAQQRDRRCAKSVEEIARALAGNYRAEHVFALQQAVELYDFYTQQIAACDAEVERQFSVIESQVDVEAYPLPPRASKTRSKNAPAFDARTQVYRVSGVDLTRIDGIDDALAQEITAEIGVDMSPWPTAKHFASWLRLAPRNDVSGGKLLRSQTGKTGNRAAQAFRMAAQAVQRSDSALGAFYRRMKSKYGAAQATTATAHKIARIVYHMLRHKEEYVDQGATYYEEQYRKRAIKNLERKAAWLGMKVVPAAT